MIPIRLLRSAEADLDTIARWCRQHRGNEFAKRVTRDILRALYEISERPLAWSVARTRADTRVRHLLQIQYSVHYQIKPHAIEIIAIRHMRRAPPR